MRLFSPYILKSIALFLWTEAAAWGQKGKVYAAQLWASPLAPTQQWDDQLPAELYRRQTQALPHHCFHGCRWSTDSGQQVSKSLTRTWYIVQGRGGEVKFYWSTLRWLQSVIQIPRSNYWGIHWGIWGSFNYWSLDCHCTEYGQHHGYLPGESHM